MSRLFTNIKVIASSSTANSYAVELATGEKIAVECGVSPKYFIERAGIPTHFWISHNHNDHNRYEKQYSQMCKKYMFENTFELKHGTTQKPCENHGFWIDDNENEERLLFAIDFYNFEQKEVEKRSRGIALVECSHDFPLYKKFATSDDYKLRLKATQWDNHACENQTIALLQHFYEPNFCGTIILLHRSASAEHSMGYSELVIRNKFPLAHVEWAQNLTK